MPIYQYRCCGKEIEVIQGYDKDASECPKCGVKMERLLTSPVMITIKGTGGTKTYSKGYKEGYSKEYLKDVSPETQG